MIPQRVITTPAAKRSNPKIASSITSSIGIRFCDIDPVTVVIIFIRLVTTATIPIQEMIIPSEITTIPNPFCGSIGSCLVITLHSSFHLFFIFFIMLKIRPLSGSIGLALVISLHLLFIILKTSFFVRFFLPTSVLYTR